MTTVFMQAGESYDESGLEYFFDCIATEDPSVNLSAGDLDSVQTNPDYLIDPSLVHEGYRYTFRLTIRDSLGNALEVSSPATASLETVVNPQVLKVPLIYPTIQDAIDTAIDGDIVELQANRIYSGDARNRNLHFDGKQITVRSENPEDPAIVASTIIDCGGSLADGANHDEMRAFIFKHGEDANSVVSGITIVNGFAINNPLEVSGDGQEAKGGAILCENGSSPMIYNCVIRDCYAWGQDGESMPIGAPANPDPGDDGVEGDWDGKPGGDGGDAAGDGYNGGEARGGALYADLSSSPIIIGCTIENTHAVGGNGGNAGRGADGGDGGNAYLSEPNAVIPENADPNYLTADGGAGGDGGDGSGDGGNGGRSAGGAFYFEGQSKAKIIDCTILDCSAILGAGGNGGIGGVGGTGGRGGEEGNPGSDGEDGASSGSAGAPGVWAMGGAIYCGDGSMPQLKNTDIQGCRAATDGSALYLSDNSSLVFDECNVDDCGPDMTDPDGVANGNAVILGLNGSAVFTDSTFTGNIGAKAALVADSNSVIELADCQFSENSSSTGNGGAVYVQNDSELTIDTCEFSDNNGGGTGGGAVNIFGNSKLTVDSSVFSGNAGGNGGAIYAFNMDTFDITNSGFYGNGSDDGGAIYYEPNFVAPKFEVTKCHFESNAAGGNGGAICIDPVWASYMPNTDILVADCNFIEGNAELGGAIFTWYTQVAIDGCTFSGNTSEYGGGAFWYAADLTITNSIFDNNLAEKSEGSSSGGALYCLDASARVYNCRFAENGAALSGGAMAIVGTFEYVSGGTQDIVNCLMVENTAVDNGGAVSVADGADPFMINCTMVGNTATGTAGFGGAVSCLYSGSPDGDTYALLENSIIWDNLAEFGPQAAVGDPLNSYNQFSMLELYYSDIEGGTGEVFRGLPAGNSAVYASGGVIDMDPLFVQTTDPDAVIDRTYYLQQDASGQLDDSPCVVYAGGNSVYDLAALETLLGFDVTTKTNHDPDDEPVDMGFHYDASLPVVSYTLTTGVYVVDYGTHGTIDPSPGDHLIPQGSIVKLIAVPEPKSQTDPNSFYRVARWIGTDDDISVELTNTITMSGDRSVEVEFEPEGPKKLYVPESYDTIEDAIIAAHDGDTIILARRPDSPYLIANPDGLNFGGKQLVITSTNPDDSSIIAETIIDCQGSRYTSKRAIHFENGEDSNSQILGITIRNAFTAEIGLSYAISTGMWPWPFDNPPDPLPPLRGLSGMDATGDSYGGAILIENGSSPTIRNCVFENCTVSGGVGGDGEDGYYGDNIITDLDLDSQSGGHSGMGSGDGYGGAIAILSGSSPQILNCTFRNNRATGGWGGIPGDAGRSYNNGRYGWGGNDPSGIFWAYTVYGINQEAGYGEGDGRGGAVFVAAGCDPTIAQCTFEDNYVRPGYVSAGGAESPGGSTYPEPFDGDTVGAFGLEWAEQGARVGRDGHLFTSGTIAGGAVFFEQDADVSLKGCRFVENKAYEVNTYDDDPVPTRGGAVFSDPNAIVRILPLRDETDPNLIISESVFSGNSAGALYCSTGVDLQIEQTQFINNMSYFPVGESTGADILILLGLAPETVPTGNYDIAGGITVEVDALVPSQIVDDCQFLGNVSHVGGGAIRTDSDMTVWDSTLNGNSSLDNGGAFYSYVPVGVPDTHTTVLKLENCELNGNDAQGLGGAGFVKNCVLTMNDCFLVSNTAFSGGALRVSAGTDEFMMSGCLIYGNNATGVIAGSHRTVTEEGFGGGLHITDTPFSIVDTRFENNTAHGIISGGGGLCITGSQSYYAQNAAELSVCE